MRARATRAGTTLQPPAAVLTGRVYLPDGRPAARATLVAWGYLSELIEGRPDVFLTGKLFSVHTDGRGRYRLRLDAGNVNGQKPSWGWSGKTDTARWDAFLVSQAGIGYAEMLVDVTRGRGVGAQDVGLKHGDRIRGKVVGAVAGGPVANARVYAMLAFTKVMRPVPLSEAWTDRQGRFRLPADLPPGAYRIGVSAPHLAFLAGQQPPRSKTPQEHTLALAMVQPPPIRGVVVGIAGEPLALARVELIVTAGREAGSELGGTSGRYITTDSHGQFVSVVDGWREEYYPWVTAYRHVLLTARHGETESEPVALDLLSPPQAELVFTLRVRAANP